MLMDLFQTIVIPFAVRALLALLVFFYWALDSQKYPTLGHSFVKKNRLDSLFRNLDYSPGLLRRLDSDRSCDAGYFGRANGNARHTCGYCSGCLGDLFATIIGQPGRDS